MYIYNYILSVFATSLQMEHLNKHQLGITSQRYVHATIVIIDLVQLKTNLSHL